MIRYIFINNEVLKIYRALPSIKFPLDVQQVVKLIPNCRYMSYQQFAKINNCSVDDVIQLCESNSGCTHYDTARNRYLILCNQLIAPSNNLGRQRWTCGHEVGHVICDHHAISAYNKLAEHGFNKMAIQECEAEADYFAATLLSPFPLFNLLEIKSAADIQKTFGLSAEASHNRFNQYLKWKSYHRKTAWENDLPRVFQQKMV